MIITFKNYKLNENPDTILYNGKTLYCMDGESIPIYITVNSDHTKVKEMFFGEWGGYHSSVGYEDKDRMYPCRLWTKSKIMTFWIYPNEILFVSMIEKIEEVMHIKIFNNDWKIEVLKGRTDNEIKRKNINKDSQYFSATFGGGGGRTAFIPVEEYAGSENVPEEEKIQHLMNWKEKELAKKAGKLHFKGWGSDKTAWDSSHNLPWRQAMYQEKKKN